MRGGILPKQDTAAHGGAVAGPCRPVRLPGAGQDQAPGEPDPQTRRDLRCINPAETSAAIVVA